MSDGSDYMRLFRGTRTLLIMAALILAFAFGSGAAIERPRLDVMSGQFSYIRAWGEFGIALNEGFPGVARPVDGYLAAMARDASGNSSAMIWDGKSISYDEKASSWAIPLAFGAVGSGAKITILSTWTQDAPFPWGAASIGFEGKQGAGPALSAASISLIGSEAFASKDGSYAVIKSGSRDVDGLYSYLVARASAIGASIKASAVKRGDAVAAIATVESPLSSSQTGIDARAAEFTLVRAVTSEDAIALAKAWVEHSKNPAGSRPDIRLTGTADKARVSPGEKISYTYFLFNAGMDQASGMAVSIPIPSGGSLLPETVRGGSGKALLLPSGVAIDLEKNRSGNIEGLAGTKEIKWEPAGSLKPGEIIKISFEFIVR